MKILNAYIESFGCFEERSFDFSGGFDLVVGDNESGKSTLLTFIKFVLYGMPRKNQENAAERERSISSRTGRASGMPHGVSPYCPSTIAFPAPSRVGQ